MRRFYARLYKVLFPLLPPACLPCTRKNLLSREKVYSSPALTASPAPMAPIATAFLIEPIVAVLVSIYIQSNVFVSLYLLSLPIKAPLPRLVWPPV